MCPSFRSLIENWHISDFHIADARPSAEVGYAEHLSTRGDNVALVAKYLYENHPQQFEKVLRAMRQRVPGVSDVEARPTEDGRLVLRFKDGSFQDPFIARYVSDGTIKMFAYLVLLYDPNPHPLLAVEEPENQLYPALMRELAEEFHDYARRGGQVFVSTHSPDFLNGAELDEIRWLVKEEGFTKVRRGEGERAFAGFDPRRRPARRALEARGIRLARPALAARRTRRSTGLVNRVVFLLEEASMRDLLNGLLPRLYPDLTFLCLAHEGKSDLEKSIPRKLRAWREPGVRFVVLRDNDGDDCLRLKQRLMQSCRAAGRPDTVVRIACQELEAWYLGEPDALADAFEIEKLREIGRNARFRDPDAVQQPSKALRRLVPGFRKVNGARTMASYLSRERNRSGSFQVLLSGLDRVYAEIGDSSSC